MKAVVFYEHGGFDKLQYIEDFPKPVINNDEVLIRVNYCSLNHLDLFVRQGLPSLKLDLPHVPGSDVAGVITEKGSNVTEFNIGDGIVINPGFWDGTCGFCLKGEHSLCESFKIIGEHLPGGYAEYVKVPARNCLKIPDGFPHSLAAAGALVYLTAWRMLKTQANLQENEDILIIGAGGGVASAAIQIAKYLGARVLTTTSSDIKMEEAKKIGADIVLNYKIDPDWWKKVYQLTNKKGVDVVLDNVGAATWESSLRSLKNGGRLVTCGATTGPIGKTNISLLFWKQLKILGSTMSTQKEFIEVMNLIFTGKLTPVISKEFPLKDARSAQEYLANMEQFGKVILKIPDS
ncbi:MAG: zinc-binding dehydrogenase [Candidatus Thorarchaeota archaeon]